MIFKKNGEFPEVHKVSKYSPTLHAQDMNSQQISPGDVKWKSSAAHGRFLPLFSFKLEFSKELIY